MAKTRSIQNTFLSGELSPLLKGNVSIGQYYQGLETAENVVIVPQGGVKRRGGLAHVDTVSNILERDTSLPAMPNGGTPSIANDGDDGTSTATTVAMGTTVDYVIAEYDTGAVDFSGYIYVSGFSISAGSASANTFRVMVSINGTFWYDAYSFGEVSTTAVSAYVTWPFFPVRYVRLVKTSSTDLGAAVANLAEFHLLNSGSTLSEVNQFEVFTETGESHLAVLTQENLAIYNHQSGVATFVEAVQTPYQSDEVNNVRVATLNNITLFFHEDYPVKRLINYGSVNIGGGASKNPNGSDYWVFDEPTFLNIPQYDFDDNLSPTPIAEQQDITFTSFTRGMRYQVEVNGVLSKNISYSGDANTDEQAATEENLRKNLQDMPVFGDSGISVNRQGALQYRITIEGESADDYKLFSGFNTTGTSSASLTFTAVANGTSRKEDIWSSTRGYPKMGAFFEGRLWIGGTRDKPQTLLASKSGSFLDFDQGGGDDDEGIFVTLSSRGGTTINDVYAGRDLQIYTSSGEYAILEPGVTPSTVNALQQTSNGSLYLPVEEVDGAVIYCDKNGKTLREHVYSFNEDAYVSNDISVLSSHLIKAPVSTAFLTGTASEDSNWLFVVNADGSGTILNKLRSQDINGFTRFSIDGSLKSCTVFGDSVSFISQRAINSTVVNHIEVWSFDHLMDAGVRQAFSSSPSGLDHLNGEEVMVTVDGILLDSRVVTSGTITITSQEAALYDSSNTLEVGLNFDVKVKAMPINTNVGSGENFLRLKRIVRMNIRVLESYGLYVDGIPIPGRSFGSEALNTPLEKFSGILDDIYPTEGWNRDTMPEITCPDPTPLHIQAIEYEVESS